MNWEALGASAELVGSAGVVISLLYLAGQIRQNSKQLRHTAATSVLNKTSSFLQGMAFTPGTGDLWARGLRGFSELRDDDERVRVGALLTDLFRTYEEAYHYRLAGVVEDWTWTNLKGALVSVVTTPGFSEWWSLRSDWFGKEFRDFIEVEVSSREGGLLEDYQKMRSLSGGPDASGASV